MGDHFIVPYQHCSNFSTAYFNDHSRLVRGKGCTVWACQERCSHCTGEKSRQSSYRIRRVGDHPALSFGIALIRRITYLSDSWQLGRLRGRRAGVSTAGKSVDAGCTQTSHPTLLPAAPATAYFSRGPGVMSPLMSGTSPELPCALFQFKYP